MYNLTDAQLKSAETFIGKLEDSMVKSYIEKLFAEVKPTMRMTSEQMEKLVSFSTHLPVEVQSFPQSFSNAVKSGIDSLSDLDGSIADVKNKKAPKNKEEVLHKLGTEEGSVEAGKKIDPVVTEEQKEEGLKEQKVEGEEIVKRNKATGEKPVIKEKKVVAPKKK